MVYCLMVMPDLFLSDAAILPRRQRAGQSAECHRHSCASAFVCGQRCNKKGPAKLAGPFSGPEARV
ncbi:MAG: hypothetical protein CPDRYMAC_5218 [uncultured Paraburkholderia sp.]|nr:MAG: hypothetical protein CPDRYDRY_5126 [uncultured Paraburkholderia sp.]CAH2940052.1 MAG: hypothetical protein CPDRYMAC_5218 [uncultured Paraburkholderia sp.]